MRASLCACTFSFKVSVERFAADGLLVEGAEAVEIGRHHRDVAYVHRLAHR
jgi:hypothetical protein